MNSCQLASCVAFVEEMNAVMVVSSGYPYVRVYQCDGSGAFLAEVGPETRVLVGTCAISCAVNNETATACILHADRIVSLWQVKNPIPRQMDPSHPLEFIGKYSLPRTSLDHPKRHPIHQAALVSIHWIHGTMWAITSESGGVIIFNISESSGLACIAPLNNHRDYISSVLTTPQCIITSSIDRTITIWDNMTFSVREVIPSFATSIVGVSYCDVLNYLVVATCDPDIVVFELGSVGSSSQVVTTLLGHKTALKKILVVNSSAISLDNHMEIKVWSLRSFQCTQSFRHISAFPVHIMVVLNRANRVCVAGKRLYYYDTTPRPAVVDAIRSAREAVSLTHSRRGRRQSQVSMGLNPRDFEFIKRSTYRRNTAM
jgi:WD40 repeat protein